jgi:putative pyruvate formate lyase activating enzyme
MGLDPVKLQALRARLAPHERACRLCPHRCGVDRLAGERGRCGGGAEAMVYKAFVHRGEERALIPSYTVFLAGCNLGCAHCSEIDHNRHPDAGRPLREAPDAATLRRARAGGARNLHWVGGEPLVHLPAILDFLARHQQVIAGWPLVFNTNLFVEADALAAVAELADLVLVDLKTLSAPCAERWYDAPTLATVVPAAIDALRAQGVPLLVRHLLVPGHQACCSEPALAWLRARPDLQVNVMTGYVPFGAAARSEGPEASLPGSAERARLAAWAQERIGRDVLVDGEGRGPLG